MSASRELSFYFWNVTQLDADLRVWALDRVVSVEILKLQWDDHALSPSLLCVASRTVDVGSFSEYNYLVSGPMLLEGYLMIGFNHTLVLWDWVSSTLLIWDIPPSHSDPARVCTPFASLIAERQLTPF